MDDSVSWRSGWDSNPREVSLKLISSQPRYDHFDTAAYSVFFCVKAGFCSRCILPAYYAITFSRLQGIFCKSAAYSCCMKTIYLSHPLPNYLVALALLGLSAADTPETADALLLTGGGDIHPHFYGQLVEHSTDIDEARDLRELALTRTFAARSAPIFGICRGLQVINVAFGGTLRQHIDGHGQLDGLDRLHETRTDDALLHSLYGTRFTVNSAHHQSVDRLGTQLRATQWADDGTVEALRHKTLPIFAVQWHPERLCGTFARHDAVDGTLVLRAFFFSS